MASVGAVGDRQPGPGQDEGGADQADGEDAGQHVAQGLDPPGAAVVGHDAPAPGARRQQLHEGDERADGARRTGAGGAVAPAGFVPAGPTGHGRGAGVVSSRLADHGDAALDAFVGEEPVGQAGHGHGLHVVGGDEGARRQARRGPGRSG